MFLIKFWQKYVLGSIHEKREDATWSNPVAKSYQPRLMKHAILVVVPAPPLLLEEPRK